MNTPQGWGFGFNQSDSHQYQVKAEDEGDSECIVEMGKDGYQFDSKTDCRDGTTVCPTSPLF